MWATKIGGVGIEVASALTIDMNGDVYSAGLFTGTEDFDPGVGIFNLVSNGQEDAYIQKLDKDGNFIWAKSFGASSTEAINGIVTDQNGMVYLTGSFVWDP